jgi:DNA-directed RNA polymerase specialized sigma24 family protein
MTESRDLRKLALSQVAQRCGQETNLFFQRERHDPRFCFELFRRAIVDRSQDAWTLVYAQYKPLVSGWVERNSSFVGCGEEVQYFVNRAFEKMWTALPSERFQRFPNLKSLLRYLQMCVHSVIVDYVRRGELDVVDVEPETSVTSDSSREPVSGGSALDRLYGEDLWRAISDRLKDDRERIVVHGSFVLALKPREIQVRYAELFPHVKDVYRVKENVLARLARDTALRAFLLGQVKKDAGQHA